MNMQSFKYVLLLLCSIATIAQLVDGYCDRIFSSPSSNDEETNGNNTGKRYSFEAPSRIKSKPYTIYRNEQGRSILSRNLTRSNNATRRSVDEDGKAMHCLYKFVANDDERVVLSFTSFRLRGNEPECNHEYVDIYVRFKQEDQFEEALGRELPNGRFCTTIVPRKLVSQHNMIVLSIYSDLEPPPDNRPIFSGVYEFIKTKTTRDQIGPPEEGTLCDHTINSAVRREGEFQSITYPGVYVKNLRCSYKFVGEPDQRIRLEFLDLDLYSGGPHCPFDSIKIFDGPEETSPIIQTICGSHRSLIIFSTHNELLITFTTLQRESEVQDRGFSAYFEFGDKFFSPNFIQGANARHIRGSECDQRIVSSKASTGTIVSPESKNRPSAICRYFFEGLQSSHDYEKVLLKFVEFDLKTPRYPITNASSSTATTATTTTTTTTTSTTTTQAPPPQPAPLSALAMLNLQMTNNNLLALLNQSINLNSSSSSSLSSDSNSLANTNATSPDQCPDNYVRLYTGEQKPDQKQDPNDYDYVFCGYEVPATIESDAASLMMEYNSGSLGGHFRAEYTFIVDYRIAGYQVSSGCDYVYRSDIMKAGSFNSPRHPSWYISDMNCTFTFLTKPDEALLLQFTIFKMSKSFGENVAGYNDVCQGEDSVKIKELLLDPGEPKRVEQYVIGTYCGTTTPGPILNFKPVQIEFKTNKEQVNYGFNAIYHFHSIWELKTNEFVSTCGETLHASHKLKSGSFSSPPTYRSETYEKRNHVCSWDITARPGYRVALDFDRFELEGSPSVRGCATAAVRLEFNKSKLPIELCGTLPAANGTGHQYVSDDERLVVMFISTKQASGSNGFTATWTEVKRFG